MKDRKNNDDKKIYLNKIFNLNIFNKGGKMKTNKELVETLKQKLDNEYNLFLYEIEQLNPKEIIGKAYEIVIKDKIKNLFNEEDNLNEYQIKGLLSLENTLDSIYEDWKKGNGIFYIDLEEQSTDFVKYIEEEYK